VKPAIQSKNTVPSYKDLQLDLMDYIQAEPVEHLVEASTNNSAHLLSDNDHAVTPTESLGFKTMIEKSAVPTTSTVSNQTKLASTVAIQTSHIPDKMFFRIGDVSELLNLKPFVLRFWETEFPSIAPQKMNGQRVYKRKDVETLFLIKHLLHEKRFSIEGARNHIKELRKGGELKTLKKEITQAPLKEVSIGRIENLKKSALELKQLASLPIEQLFKF
jgi:DNA-binding transcriptional MerR regulator